MPATSSRPCAARPPTAAMVSHCDASSSCRPTPTEWRRSSSCSWLSSPSRPCRHRTREPLPRPPSRPTWCSPRPHPKRSPRCAPCVLVAAPLRCPSSCCWIESATPMRRRSSPLASTMCCRNPCSRRSCVRAFARHSGAAGSDWRPMRSEDTHRVSKSINPTTEEVVETFQEFEPAQIEQALDQSFSAQRIWRQASFGERAARLQSVARVLRAQKSRLAALATQEMGKTIVEAEAEVEKCAWNCDFYAEHAVEFLADEHVEMGLSDSFVAFEPLGVVLAIMPWNFPFWQVMRFAAPALMAGNGAVLKHASNVPRCALAIEEALRTAGLPDGLFRTVLVTGGGGERIGSASC